MHSVRMELGVFKMRFVVAALSLIAASARAAAPFAEYKLPLNFIPVRYSLSIVTHMEDDFWFKGLADITVACTEATDTVVLHASHLKIDHKDVKVSTIFGKGMPVVDVRFEPAKDFMIIKCGGHFKPGDEYLLTIHFTGNITENLVGYYRSSYVDKKTGLLKWIAVTQFEPMDARRAFPCFDEPAMKAKFKMRVGHRKGLKSVSNMPLLRSARLSSVDGYVLDEFEESVPMSTYLLAYMVSDFEYVQAPPYGNGVKFRTLVRKDAVNQTALPNKLGPRVLKYYEDYFDQPYPLAKQDMVALPDFSSGAMENWGLITYRESALLVDPKVSTLDNIHRVAEVIAHEISHQWFGNLVTMCWWTDLWLNEGFATYLAAKGVDFLYPEWNAFQVETALNFIRVLHTDSLQSSHPVSVTIKHPGEISQIFDTISYTKGAYLLHMINLFLGEHIFRRGVQNYIQKHKYSNAEQDDLWIALTNEAHRVGTLDKKKTVKEIMNTWTLQTGYPVVKVIRNYSTNTLNISQERFLTIKSNITDKSCWWIPLTMTTSEDLNFRKTKVHTWLNCKNSPKIIPMRSNDDWIIFNIQLAGLYRVMYDSRNWMGLIRTLNNPIQYKTIHTMNRLQLVDDALSFAQIGDLDYEIVFELLNYLKHENEYLPWVAALNGLNPIGKYLSKTPIEGVYKAYMRRLLIPMYTHFHNMTFEHKGFEEVRLKNIIVTASCQSLVQECIDQCIKLFKDWAKTAYPDKINTLPKELKSTIYCQTIKHEGVEEWDFLWRRYKKSNVAAERARILSALGCSSKTWLLERYLNRTIGPNAVIRKQDAVSVFYAVANNEYGYKVAKTFLFEKIKEIADYFNPQSTRVGNYLTIIGSLMKTDQELEELKSFINKSSVYFKGAEMAISQAIETAKINAKWTTQFYHTIVKYMV